MLYEYEEVEKWCEGSGFDVVGVELSGGVTKALTADEKKDPRNKAPGDGRLWRGQGLLSQNASEGEQGRPFPYKGVTYGPRGLANDQWRVDQEGLRYLGEKNRLWSSAPEEVKEASARQLYLKVFKSESPGKRVSNQWPERILAQDKRYAVQTGDLAITRCMLMTTNSGDLVLDPTGGGGTTALVAERWGRRWISIDSSRESIAVTRERVLVHDYPRHMLIGSEEGFQEEQRRREAAGQPPLAKKPEGELDSATGLVVDRIPYVSAATLAYAERSDKRPKRDVTWLIDRTAGRPSGRVCSRFTVETELMEVYQRPDDMVRPTQARRDVSWRERIVRMLDETGVRSDSGQQWDMEGVQSIVDEESNGKTPGVLSHTGTLVDRQSGRKKAAVIGIWPDDAKVDVTAIHRNVQEVMKRSAKEVLIAVGAEFADGTEPGEKGHRWAAEVMRVKAGPELHLAGVKDKARTSPMVLVAEPAVQIDVTENGQLTCTVCGWNEFNPVTGAAHWRTQEDVQMWMLDTDYDGTQFCARRIHLPRSLRRTENRRVLDGLLGRNGCPEALSAAFGWASHPFPAPASGEIAVRVVTAGGGMMNWSGVAKK